MSKGKFSIEEKIAKFTGRDRIKVEEIIKPFLAIPNMSIDEVNVLADLYSEEKKLKNFTNSSYLSQRHDELKAKLMNTIMKRACSVALLRANTPEELEDYINQAILSGMELLERYHGGSDFYGALNTLIGRTLDEYIGKKFRKCTADAVLDIESGGASYLVTVKRSNETVNFFIIRDESVGEDSYVPEVYAEHSELKYYLEQVLNTLPPREEHIIKLRFGLEDGYVHSLDEIADMYHVGRFQVAAILSHALRKIYLSPKRSKLLIDFLK